MQLCCVALVPAWELFTPSYKAENIDTIRKQLLAKWTIDFVWYSYLYDFEWILVCVKK